jgi:hypothetical protein
MSGIQEGRDRAFIAGEDLSGSRFIFVKLHTTQNQVVAATAGTDDIIGVVTNSPRASASKFPTYYTLRTVHT